MTTVMAKDGDNDGKHDKRRTQSVAQHGCQARLQRRVLDVHFHDQQQRKIRVGKGVHLYQRMTRRDIHNKS